MRHAARLQTSNTFAPQVSRALADGIFVAEVVATTWPNGPGRHRMASTDDPVLERHPWRPTLGGEPWHGRSQAANSAAPNCRSAPPKRSRSPARRHDQCCTAHAVRSAPRCARTWCATSRFGDGSDPALRLARFDGLLKLHRSRRPRSHLRVATSQLRVLRACSFTRSQLSARPISETTTDLLTARTL